jgi:hypothetical protein
MNDNAPWRIPPDLRPAEQPEALSVDAKLIAAEAALAIVREAVDQERSKITGKRWSQRPRGLGGRDKASWNRRESSSKPSPVRDSAEGGE